MAAISFPNNSDEVGIGPYELILTKIRMSGNGWATSVTVWAKMDGIQNGNARFALYVEGQRKGFSDTQAWGPASVARTGSFAPVRVAEGDLVSFGVYSTATQDTSVDTPHLFYQRDNGATGATLESRNADAGMPSALGAAAIAQGGRAMRGNMEYIANAAPSAGAWVGTSASGQITTLTPRLSGSLPHANGDGSLDYTTSVHLQVYRTDTGEMTYNGIFNVTAAERDAKTFDRTGLVNLQSGVSYAARFRHYDSFGAVGPFSAERYFQTAQAADPPAPVSPVGKINEIFGYSYSAIHSHPQNLSANGYEVEVYNAAGTVLLYSSGVVSLGADIAPGGTVTVSEFHADLSWATEYTWRIRVRDTAGVMGSWSAKTAFRTNAPPSAPTELSPSGGKLTPSRVFTAKVSDPDSDPITAAQIELVNVATNVVVTGYPKAMTVSGGTVSIEAPAADMVIGTDYKWRTRATDGLSSGYGTWSSYATFKYAEAPVVTLLAPSLTSRTNLVKQPSAEYDPASLSAYWTETARTATDFIDRAFEGAFGDYSWRGTASAGDNRFQGAMHAVDATKPYLASVYFEKESGISATHFCVLCYNGAGSLLGTLYPSSIRIAQGIDAPLGFVRHGGIVWPAGSANAPAFPAGTTQARLEITPSRNFQAVVSFDAASFERVPLLSSADWAEAQRFFGYGDAGLTGYGREASGYSWTGPVGDSPSEIPAILTTPPAKLAISYSSAQAKQDDRTFVERWTGSAWVSVHDSGWVASARTLISVTPNPLSNEGRYRVKVQARNAVNVVGETDWAEFDVRYEGPDPPGIVIATSDPTKATLDITLGVSSLPQLEFAGREVAVRATDGTEPERVVALLTSPEDTDYSYPFPVSAKPYEVMARDIQVVGAEQVEGRWSRVALSVDYSGFYFVKDVDDPANLWAKYRVFREALQSIETVPALEESYFPWGAEVPTHLSSPGERRSGTVEARFLSDLAGQTADEGYAALKEILARRRAVCLLSHYPERDKVFARRVGRAGFGSFMPTKRSITFAWEQTAYSEAYYERSPNGTA